VTRVNVVVTQKASHHLEVVPAQINHNRRLLPDDVASPRDSAKLGKAELDTKAYFTKLLNKH
jgi:hypothetical protein